MEETQEEKNKVGRPSKYDPAYCLKVDEYLELMQDEDVKVVKQSSDKYEMFDNKLKVKLPTLDGFARFIGVPRSTMFDWKDEFKEFSDSLEKILVEQKQRLLDNGLSGDYNPTIAKLILSSNHNMADKNQTDLTSGGKEIGEIKWTIIDGEDNS